MISILKGIDEFSNAKVALIGGMVILIYFLNGTFADIPSPLQYSDRVGVGME